MLEWLTSKKGKGSAAAAPDAQLISDCTLLVKQTRQLVEQQGTMLNLTSRLQLRDDCQLVEQTMKKLLSSPTSANHEKLQKALLRLKTTSENILNWQFVPEPVSGETDTES